MRIAPKAGYDFPAKRDYRRKVWATFRRLLKELRIPIAESHALLMPSLEGDEIQVALNTGFRESNLHVVDYEPAIVATLKKRHPKINTYGVSLSRAMSRIADKGIRIRCANFDFCGCLSVPYMSELGKAIYVGYFGGTAIDYKDEQNRNCTKYIPGPEGRGSLETRSLIAVSLLRGRESTPSLNRTVLTDESLDEWVESTARSLDVHRDAVETTRPVRVMRSLSSIRDRERVALVERTLTLKALANHIQQPSALPIRAEYYLSASGQTMLWAVFGCEAPAEVMKMSA